MPLVLVIGVFVLVQGQQDVDRWQDAIDTGQLAQEESIAEALGYFADGEKGPPDRSWVDLGQAHWQDMYAATRIARMPAPLSSIAFASAESGAVTVRVNRFADPLLEQGNKIENPALVAAGGLDLVTVLALLLPLLVLALGVEVGGYERSAGVLPLVRVQSGGDRTWIWARCIAVGAIAATVGLLLCFVAVLTAGADLGSGLTLTLLVLAYVAFWTALLGVVAQVSRNPSHGAVALGAAWIVFCVLIPSIGVERSAALAASDFALDLTVDARDAGSAISKMDEDDLFAGLFARFPELKGKEPTPRMSGRRAANEGMRIAVLDARMQRREGRGDAFAQLVSKMSLATPTLAFTNALEQLAGRGPAAAREFNKAVAEAAGVRMEHAIAASWSGDPQDQDDFSDLVHSTPTRIQPPTPIWRGSLAILLAWVLLILGGGAVFARRFRS
ncbi:MAG: hypothetical protein GY747_12810 [Planctomycetes bacterium]|nr:hypothetical protein [Planctomycetota bacterium]MCP4770558.1 hypothetical protein [Planctomycetota bacterium]MCP4860351.1 hypothetical protein [Planctomycetota bacterium]